jgi:hypothetical protein
MNNKNTSPTMVGNSDASLATVKEFHVGAGHPLKTISAAAELDAHTLPDAHAGRAVVPTLLGIVVAKTGGGVDFVPIGVPIGERLAEHGEIILHSHEQDVSLEPGNPGDIKLKRLEKTLVRAEADTVQIDLAAVVHRIEAKHLPLLGKYGAWQVQNRSVER